jgi:hypothetical protein
MKEHREKMEKLKRIEKAKDLPLIRTEDTDLKAGEHGLPRMDADERGSEEKKLPLINTEDTDLSGGMGKILPQPAGGGAEVYANQRLTS